MSTSLTRTPRPWNAVVLPNVGWLTYGRVARSLAEKRNVRIAYDRGDLEIRAIEPGLDDGLSPLKYMVTILTQVLRYPLQTTGAMAIRRRRLERAIQPEACFWFHTAHRLLRDGRIDPRLHPPELVFEFDTAASVIDRDRVYAALRVPEIWRLEGGDLRFQQLDPGRRYTTTPTSRAFPLIEPSDITPFLERAWAEGNQLPAFRAFEERVRQKLDEAITT